MGKYSLPVLGLNATSAITSGLGAWAIAKDMPQLENVPTAAIAVGCVALTGVIQGFINGGWRPVFLGTSSLTGSLTGGIATMASFVTATAGWLMALDGAGLQGDLQRSAVAPHQEVLLLEEQKYIGLNSAFFTLSDQMQSKAKIERETGPSCDNDSPAKWVKKCGPRCRFMNRTAGLTSDMAGHAETLGARMSNIALKLATGTQEEIDTAYTEAVTLSRSTEMGQLRSGVAAVKRDLTGSITDPKTGKSFICRMKDTLALVENAEAELTKVMVLPSRPVRPEPEISDSIMAAYNTAQAMLNNEGDTLRASEKTSFWLAFMVEFLLLLVLYRDARKAVRQGTEWLEPEEVDAARPRKAPRDPETLRKYLGLLDRYTVNAGRWGKYFAVPYDGEDSAFRTQCLEVVDYLKLNHSKLASSAIDMRPIQPEWVNSRATETGRAELFELYTWPGKLDAWRRFARRNTR